MKIDNPHDKFFKETLGNVDVARDFLHNYLPQNTVGLVDTDTLEPEKDSFINEMLEEGFSDLLFSADINKQKGYIYFLFEHKSFPAKDIAFQLLKYMTEIWNTKMNKEKMAQLPIVIPLVIYHGKTGWSIEKTLGGMITGYKELSKDIQRFVPDYEYLLYDLSDYTDEEIKGEARLRVLFTALRDVSLAKDAEELWETIDKAAAYLQELEDKQTGIMYFETFIKYIFNVGKQLTKAYADEIAERIKVIYPEGSEVIMTLAEQFREEGKKEGKKEGKAEGKSEVVRNAIREGMELRLIEKLTGLSKKEIEKIAEEMKD